MSEQITSLPARTSAAPEGSGIVAVEGAGVGAVLAGALLDAALGAIDAAAVGAWVGAVVADPLQAETVIATTAIAAVAVRNERMQDLLQEID